MLHIASLSEFGTSCRLFRRLRRTTLLARHLQTSNHMFRDGDPVTTRGGSRSRSTPPGTCAHTIQRDRGADGGLRDSSGIRWQKTWTAVASVVLRERFPPGHLKPIIAVKGPMVPSSRSVVSRHQTPLFSESYKGSFSPKNPIFDAENAVSTGL